MSLPARSRCVRCTSTTADFQSCIIIHPTVCCDITTAAYLLLLSLLLLLMAINYRDFLLSCLQPSSIRRFVVSLAIIRQLFLSSTNRSKRSFFQRPHFVILSYQRFSVFLVFLFFVDWKSCLALFLSPYNFPLSAVCVQLKRDYDYQSNTEFLGDRL